MGIMKKWGAEGWAKKYEEKCSIFDEKPLSCVSI
jgi:hypothetical protein